MNLIMIRKHCISMYLSLFITGKIYRNVIFLRIMYISKNNIQYKIYSQYNVCTFFTIPIFNTQADCPLCALIGKFIFSVLLDCFQGITAE